MTLQQYIQPMSLRKMAYYMFHKTIQMVDLQGKSKRKVKKYVDCN